jgi:hypothetical protein
MPKKREAGFFTNAWRRWLVAVLIAGLIVLIAGPFTGRPVMPW